MPVKALIPALLVLAAIGVADLPATFGAHPWWSGKVVLIGAPVGFALAWLASQRIPTLALVVTFFFATTVAATTAVFGKRVFVASFGDNALAGQAWFFGWIATMAGVAALIASATFLILRR